MPSDLVTFDDEARASSGIVFVEIVDEFNPPGLDTFMPMQCGGLDDIEGKHLPGGIIVDNLLEARLVGKTAPEDFAPGKTAVGVEGIHSEGKAWRESRTDEQEELANL